MNNYENLINKMLDGRYRLTRIIGGGGMAVVYEADDLAMNRKVAVKMLKDEIKEDAQEVKRFINESKAVAMLSHPNIVHIYDVSKNSSNSQYIVMELIDGIDLKDYILRKGRLKWQEAISYAEQILSGLKHAHSRGIIHRDIKPQNIMLLRNGSLKITDFGIAKMQGSEPLTMTDKAIGTVHYISPEQANSSKVTNVSDIYSLGVLLYEMTTGQLPFEGDTAINVAMKQINEIPKNPRELNPEIPKGLSQIILKAMNKDPQDRYQSAGEMIKQLSILSANPAVVFNNNSGSNLPVVAGSASKSNIKDIEALNNRKDIQAEVSGRLNNVTDIENINNADKIDEDEMRKRGRQPQKGIRRRSSRSMLPIISGVTLAFLIVLGVSGFNIFLLVRDSTPGFSGTEETVTIPDYRGILLNETLKAEMEKLRLTVGNITYATNDNFGKGQVIKQSPEPEEVRKFRNKTDKIAVDFVISQGKDTYVVEDLTVMDYREVELMIKSHRILINRIPEPHDTIPSGYIIYTEPMEGVLMNAGDTIDIYVSTGQEIKKVLMPDVVGKTEAEARKILYELQIYIKEIKTEYSDVVPAGRIIEQDIPYPKEVPAKSTRVTLKKSLGPRIAAAEPVTAQNITEESEE